MKIMKTMNKVIAVMIMAITTAMPAMAGNHKYNNGKKDKAAVVTIKDKKTTHFNKADKKKTHFASYKHAYRPDVKTCTFKVSRRNAHKNVVAKVEHMNGVMNTKWNPRTREVTVIYDAKVTSARHIIHFVA